MTQLYDRHLAPLGVRITQMSVLRHIQRHGPLTMRDLAEVIVMDRTTLTRALRPLQRDGLITIEPGADARTRILSPTQAGLSLLDQVDPLWSQAQAEFERRYGASETLDLRAMLARVVVRMA